MRLHLSTDCEFIVPPLALPTNSVQSSQTELAEVESVKLFIERAKAVKPNFELTQENMRSVGEICMRLDGLPLAIELAAARAKIIPPQSILERLENRLDLLTGGAKDLPSKQQTVRGMVEWSYGSIARSGRESPVSSSGDFLWRFYIRSGGSSCRRRKRDRTKSQYLHISSASLSSFSLRME